MGKIRYPLLSDIHKEIARSYDVLLENEGVALRGMFIIDKEGILRHITVNDLPIGRSVDEALRLIEAIQFTEEHGEGRYFFFSKNFFSLIDMYVGGLHFVTTKYLLEKSGFFIIKGSVITPKIFKVLVATGSELFIPNLKVQQKIWESS